MQVQMPTMDESGNEFAKKKASLFRDAFEFFFERVISFSFQ
jgi:hypothetical protein